MYGVDLDEAEAPPEGWRSLDAFFTRRLIPGARPLPEDPGLVPSPADGRLLARGRLTEDAVLEAKGRAYRVDELLDRPGAAREYAGGFYGIVYLAPPDYHRVHAAFDGPVRRAHHVPGEHFPVNALGERLVPDLLVRNERVVVEQDVQGVGSVATVLVGALAVRRITLSFPAPGRGGLAPRLSRGDELGVFHLGSTVVLLAQSPAGPLVDPGERVLVGRPLGRVRDVGEAG